MKVKDSVCLSVLTARVRVTPFEAVRLSDDTFFDVIRFSEEAFGMKVRDKEPEDQPWIREDLE